ncbi:MAG: serine hydrolase domain-containing protein [Christiangramia sp.]|nr:serine hydrolase domain-containing protein [Christiangramia sp.]
MHYLRSLATVFTIFLTLSTYAQPGVEPGKTNETSSLEQKLKEYKVPALALAVIKNWKISDVEVYGELYKGKKTKLNSVFNVASLTKPVVTMLTLKLVENGDWKLDEPLYNHYTDPDVKDDPWSKILTSRHVLSHQSGFPNWRNAIEDGILKFNYIPGQGYGYSGEAFEYLKNALESRFEMPIEKLADSLIFQPNQMAATKFYWDDSITEENFAKWHDANGENTYPTYKNKKASAADDLLTTIADYARFAEYVLDQTTSTDGIYKEMLVRQNGKENSTAMGLGWEILPDLKDGQDAILHTGGDYGVNTIIILLPETGEGLVIFTNGDNGKNLYFDLIERHLSLCKQITDTAQ